MPKSSLPIATVSEETIVEKIYIIRGHKVMLDRDSAEMYGVPTFRLNEQVKRNMSRFPDDFMFQLTKDEYDSLRSQIAILKRGKHSKYLPYAFTEQGVAMLSGILNSDRAIKMNIAIMRAFVEVRRVLLQQTDIKEQLRLIQERMTEHDVQLSQIYDSIENLLDEKAAQRKWDERVRIGFKK